MIGQSTNLNGSGSCSLRLRLLGDGPPKAPLGPLGMLSMEGNPPLSHAHAPRPKDCVHSAAWWQMMAEREREGETEGETTGVNTMCVHRCFASEQDDARRSLAPTIRITWASWHLSRSTSAWSIGRAFICELQACSQVCQNRRTDRKHVRHTQTTLASPSHQSLSGSTASLMAARALASGAGRSLVRGVFSRGEWAWFGERGNEGAASALTRRRRRAACAACVCVLPAAAASSLECVRVDERVFRARSEPYLYGRSSNSIQHSISFLFTVDTAEDTSSVCLCRTPPAPPEQRKKKPPSTERQEHFHPSTPSSPRLVPSSRSHTSGLV